MTVSAITAQRAATDALMVRIDTAGAWAIEIDDEWPDLSPGAERAYARVIAAWRGGSGDDDGPAVMACYARALTAAVQDVADSIADQLTTDPRTNGALGSALTIPASLA